MCLMRVDEWHGHDGENLQLPQNPETPLDLGFRYACTDFAQLCLAVRPDG